MDAAADAGADAATDAGAATEATGAGLAAELQADRVRATMAAPAASLDTRFMELGPPDLLLADLAGRDRASRRMPACEHSIGKNPELASNGWGDDRADQKQPN